MKLNKLPVFSIVLATALFGTPALAQQVGQFEQGPEAVDSELYLAEVPPAVGGEMPGGPRQSLFETLGLTDEQMDKLVELKNQYALNTAGKKVEMKIKFHQMMHLLGDGDIDKGKVMSVQNEISSMQNDLAKTRANFMADSAAVFTPDQRKQMRHMMYEHILMMSGPCAMPCVPTGGGAREEACPHSHGGPHHRS